jgi:hypothetical protein
MIFMRIRYREKKNSAVPAPPPAPETFSDVVFHIYTVHVEQIVEAGAVGAGASKNEVCTGF